MPKSKPHSLKHRDFIKKLKSFNVIEDTLKGKGSERMLIQKFRLASKYKGPQIPIKCHGDGTEHSVRVIDTVLRRFNIDPDQFWS